jgi:predicted component of type VI protein secretion system
MPILYVLSGPDIGKTYDVGEGAVLGRVADCDVVLRSASVSRKHARLELDGERWVLTDIGSANGLWLEGKRVEDIELEDGLSFRVGELELRFRHVAQGAVGALRAQVASTEPEPELESFEEEPEPAEESGGIEFEDESLFDAAPKLQKAPISAPMPAAPEKPKAPPKSAPNRQAERLAAAGIQLGQASAGRGSEGGRPILQYSRNNDSAGFLTSDLGQYPLWIRFVAGFAAVAVFGAIFYFAMQGAQSLKGRAVDKASTEFEDSAGE